MTRHYRNSIAVLMGVAMNGPVAYVDEEEDGDGNELTLITRRPVFRHGAELRLKVIEAGEDVIYHLGIEQKGFTPFAADVMIHDIGKDNFETQVELSGDMIAAQSFLGHFLRNPD